MMNAGINKRARGVFIGFIVKAFHWALLLSSIGVSPNVAASESGAPVIEEALEGEGEPVSLPRIEVEASRLSERPLQWMSWRYATVGRLEIISMAPDDITREWLREELLLEGVVREIIHPLIGRKHIGKIYIILCDGESLFNMFGRHDLNSVDFFSLLISDDRFIKILRTDKIEYWRSEHRRGNPEALSYYTYYRADSARFYPQLPLWVSAAMYGLSRSTGTALTEDSIIIGKAGSWGQTTAFNSGVPRMKAGALPVKSVLDPEYFEKIRKREKERVTWYDIFAPSQMDNHYMRRAFFLLHYILMAENGRRQGAFIKYLRGAPCHPDPEGWFKECFELSWSDMDRVFRKYELSRSYPVREYRNTKGEGAATAVIRESTLEERARIVGEALMASRDYPGKISAKVVFRDPRAVASEEPELLASRALFEYSSSGLEEAHAVLEQAAALAPDRSRLYLALSGARLALLRKAGKAEPFDRESANYILDPLRFGLKLENPLPQLYVRFSEILSNSDLTPDHDDLNIIWQGVSECHNDCYLTIHALLLTLRSGLLLDPETNELDILCNHPLAKDLLGVLKTRSLSVRIK